MMVRATPLNPHRGLLAEDAEQAAMDRFDRWIDRLPAPKLYDRTRDQLRREAKEACARGSHSINIHPSVLLCLLDTDEDMARIRG